MLNTAGMRTSLLLCFILGLSGKFYAQESVPSGKLSYHLGTSLAFPIATNRFLETPDDSISFKRDYAVFPPKVDAGVQLQINNRWSASFNTQLRGLQNTRFEFSEEEFVSNVGQLSYDDNFKVRMNVVSNTLAIRFHFDKAPVGNYLELGSGIASTFCKIYPTMVDQLEAESPNTTDYNDTTKLAPWKQKVHLPFVALGIGKTYAFPNGFGLDFGVKSTFHFGPRTFTYSYSAANDNSNIDFKSVFETPVKSLVTRNLNSSYLLEFYIRITRIN